MIGRANKVQGLYVLSSHSFDSACAVTSNKTSAQLWHDRLGHPSVQRLVLLQPLLRCDFSILDRQSPCLCVL